ncbi:hypothetical protein HYH03_009176 [Edaphochlamys debaryana]|uniref:Uncharacterized protein n=1 Tax=Edaphochlamys debaryana TaxID=47281 RepID=A0A835XYG1_9CHLO|nr:hypothetical protein HYH03_009176 [Edaphochlamys debaryana]|eukprot:KAG2492511.1 hypothetical protein HYH03_009176 [Edaphochlamys debaryana]
MSNRVAPMPDGHLASGAASSSGAGLGPLPPLALAGRGPPLAPLGAPPAAPPGGPPAAGSLPPLQASTSSKNVAPPPPLGAHGLPPQADDAARQAADISSMVSPKPADPNQPRTSHSGAGPAPGASPFSGPAAPPPPPPPQHGASLAATPAAPPRMSQNGAKQLPAFPSKSPTPSTPGVAPAPAPDPPGVVPGTPAAGGGGGGRGAAVGSPGGSPHSAPPPPTEPPPPAAVVDKPPPDPNDLRPTEEYIPFGFVDLRGKLIADHPAAFRAEGAQKKFEELTKWISMRNSLRLELDYGDAHEKYAPLDPDKDTLAFKAAAAAAAVGAAEAGQAGKGKEGASVAGGKEASRSGGASPSKRGGITERVEAFDAEFSAILDKAEFEPLPQEDLDKAKNDKSLMGLDVTSASEEYLDYQVYYRGSRQRKIAFRRWGLFHREMEMHLYERLAIRFRLKKPVHADDLPADGALPPVDPRPWYKRMFSRGPKVPESLMALRDEFMYMKLFKDVLQCDVDMLLPGSVIKFTWFDHCMIWIPILVGLGLAVWKMYKGTIQFDNPKDALLSLVLIVMPITWGVKAWLAVKEKQRKHQAHLNALFIVHNLNNNGGVISQLLDEAQEQEDNEAMLAYFFLWQAQAGGQAQGLSKQALDRKVEEYLQRKLDEVDARIRMDFEVTDSIKKLERMSLLTVTISPSQEKMLTVLPLDQAVDKAHVRHFNEGRETGVALGPRGPKASRGAAELDWHECETVLPAGLTVRYYWNAATRVSTYWEPDEPYVPLSKRKAVRHTDAHGESLRDDAKYEPQPAPPPDPKKKL